jgi:hypothetical protein
MGYKSCTGTAETNHRSNKRSLSNKEHKYVAVSFVHVHPFEVALTSIQVSQSFKKVCKTKLSDNILLRN